MTISLHERGVGENLSLFFSIIWANLGKLTLLSLLFTLPGMIPAVMEEIDFRAWVGRADDYSLVINFLLYPLMIGSIIGIVTGSYTGERISMTRSIRLASGRWLHLVAFGFLYHLGIALGTLLLIVPGYMFLSAFYLGFPAIVIEKLGFRTVFKRSARLTRGFRRDIVAAFLLLGLLAVIPLLGSLALMRVVGEVPTSIGLDSRAITNLLMQWTVVSFLVMLHAVAPVVFYFQIRGTQGDFSFTSLADLVDRIHEERSSESANVPREQEQKDRPSTHWRP